MAEKKAVRGTAKYYLFGVKDLEAVVQGTQAFLEIVLSLLRGGLGRDERRDGGACLRNVRTQSYII